MDHVVSGKAGGDMVEPEPQEVIDTIMENVNREHIII